MEVGDSQNGSWHSNSPTLTDSSVDGTCPKYAPVIVNSVPPRMEPCHGSMLCTCGAAWCVMCDMRLNVMIQTGLMLRKVGKSVKM